MTADTNHPVLAGDQAFPPVEEQLSIIMRGVDYGDPDLLQAMTEELRQRLAESCRTGRPLTAYVGIDPTATDLTLGHTVPLRKLGQLQDLGHRGVFVIGTMTAVVGDPSDKTAARRHLTPDETEANAATYIQQAFKVLDPNKTEIRRNSDWLAGLTFAPVIDLASNFTVQQFLQRENFALRFERGEPIWLHEFFYSLMQAYDAVQLQADIQIGGTEQLFNLMAGRKLQEASGQRPQIPITLPILVGTDGHLRMSKTTGNYIGVLEPAEQQYGKTMSLPDEAMANWFNLVTSLRPTEIQATLRSVERGDLHPMVAKKRLAQEIVTLFHGPEAAAAAADYFARTIQSKEQPTGGEMPTWRIEAPAGIVDVLTGSGLASSNSEARRLIAQGGVRFDNAAVTDPFMVVDPGPPRVIQVGKRRFLQVV
jgi:tyrosyl-tRNA synthetase